jgi:hypothetical protein
MIDREEKDREALEALRRYLAANSGDPLAEKLKEVMACAKDNPGHRLFATNDPLANRIGWVLIPRDAPEGTVIREEDDAFFSFYLNNVALLSSQAAHEFIDQFRGLGGQAWLSKILLREARKPPEGWRREDGTALGDEDDPPSEEDFFIKDGARHIFWVPERQAWHVLGHDGRLYAGASDEDVDWVWWNVSETRGEIEDRIPGDRTVWDHLQE